MKEEFFKLNEQINLCKSQDGFDKVISEWQINNDEIDSWIDTIWENIDEFDFQRLPYVLEALYKQNDKIKFMLFCMILEGTHDRLPFITNLEDLPIFKEKYKILAPTIAKVTFESYNGIADALYLILLNADPEGALLTDEDKEKIISGINKKLPLLKKYLENDEEIPEMVHSALEIILDVSCYLNNGETLSLLKEFSDLKLNLISKIFLVKNYAINNIEISNEDLEKLAISEYAHKLLSVLEKINKVELLKNTSLNQEKVAKSEMIEWLKYPTELGDSLEKIEFVDTLEKDEYTYYIYKFTSNSESFSERGYMIGIAGGFENNKLTSRNTGHTFSQFERLEEDYKVQAEELIKLISDYWKNKNNN